MLMYKYRKLTKQCKEPVIDSDFSRPAKHLGTTIFPHKITRPCNLYIEDNQTLCDFHLEKKYLPGIHATYDTLDHLGMEEFYRAHEVLEAIRKIVGE